MKGEMSEEVKRYIEDLYLFKHWGDGFLSVNDQGNLTLLPEKNENGPKIDLANVLKEVKERRIELPVVLRFPNILQAQVEKHYKLFHETITEAGYQGKFVGVYPIKVNSMKEVVEEIIKAGKPFEFGLEAGSKAELLSVLAYNNGALTVLNGQKDPEFMKLALLGVKMGKKAIVVIEKIAELGTLLKVAEEMGVEPLIGIRAKINAQGSGKWAESAGEKAKFGLTIPEILRAFNSLKEKNLLHTVKLLHFHVGSQITNIQTVKQAISESARIYAELRKMGMPIEYLDVGGGLGVDYDGSQSTGNSSRNYNTETYIAEIVYGIQQVCDLVEVPHPNIVTESGRALTAHHACVITEVMGKIDYTNEYHEIPDREDDHVFIKNIKNILKFIDEEDFNECFNDALAIKSDTENAFKLGVISLEERGQVESTFWEICKKLKAKTPGMEFVPEAFKNFQDKLSTQYICNFSIFQSLPDTWAINQMIPVVPITRLNELPEVDCSLVDITCDSDGKIDQFINLNESSKTIRLHSIKEGEPYFLGFFLTGAYQDVMGMVHNLFGRLNEVHVYGDVEDESNFYIEEVIRGDSARDVLSQMKYNPEHLLYKIKKILDSKVSAKKIAPRESFQLMELYEKCMRSYTYLRG